MASFLNKAARYGLYAAVSMARDPDAWITAAAIAQDFGISQNHVAKVLLQLARAGLVRSTRGLNGGYQLAREPSEITMLEVVECLDGPLQDESARARHLAERRDGQPVAGAVHDVLAELNRTAYFTLKSITLATVAKSCERGSPSRLLDAI